MQPFDPIVEVSMKAVDQENLTVSECSDLRRCLLNFVDGLIDYDSASNIFSKIAGKTTALERAKAILEVGDTPLPPPGCNFESSSNLFAPGKRFMMLTPERPWSYKEDNRLVMAIKKFGIGNWIEIANFVGSGRKRTICQQRWIRHVNPLIDNGPWSVEDDEKLMSLVKKFGERSWMAIANAMQTRTDTQCKFRYNILASRPQIDDRNKIEVVAMFPKLDLVGLMSTLKLTEPINQTLS